jgi:hypothetical protein
MKANRLAMFAVCVASAALAQEQPPPDDELPTLDELLGTEGEASESTDAETLPEEDAELDRLLSGSEIADEFRQAVDLMGRSATRLTTARDTGSRTQRMQEDALRKLDKLISDAERRAQQASSSPSPSADRQQAQPQPRQQTQQQAGNGDNRGEVNPPALRSGPLSAEEAADLAAWGSLPARVRDALVQGSSDKFSAAYRKLTEAYYKMLAEEPRR